MNKYKKVIVIASVLSVSLILNIANAASWTPPTNNPPLNNTPAPINVSGSPQHKDGAFSSFGKISALGTGNIITAEKFCLNTTGKPENCVSGIWPAGSTTGTGSGDVRAASPQKQNFLTKWYDATSKVITNSAFYEDASGRLCTGIAPSQICFGNGKPGTDGLKGIMGSDGTVLSCLASESGKVLQWNGKGWVCGTVGGGTTTGGGITGSGTGWTIPIFSGTAGVAGSNVLSDSPILVTTTSNNITYLDLYKLGSVTDLGYQTRINSKTTINGVLRVADGTQGTNKILASDATGNASWKHASEIPGLGVNYVSTSNVIYSRGGNYINIGGPTISEFWDYLRTNGLTSEINNEVSEIIYNKSFCALSTVLVGVRSDIQGAFNTPDNVFCEVYPYPSSNFGASGPKNWKLVSRQRGGDSHSACRAMCF
ncbi:MAG: hypothetical protein UT05_C0009G0037 [Parcubacteria group bacterium GW2011_GWF2_38_76]|nr:MAG: hypothetical protein UT05_C0009G0037 [Parcubacteria group bacterium GW2011_GWF2_38_76]HBM45478.1 hypothetical protein [Patescibacteria group bacterium]